MIVAPLALTEMECVIQEGLQVMTLRVDDKQALLWHLSGYEALCR